MAVNDSMIVVNESGEMWQEIGVG